MKTFVFLIITTFTLSSSKKLVHKASLSQEDDFDSDIDKLLREETDAHLFYYAGVLRQTLALEALQNVQGNAVCSPVAALLAIAKLMLGATGMGLQELIAVIGVTQGSDEFGALAPSLMMQLIKNLQSLPGAELEIASKIYVPKEGRVNKNFIDSAYHIFRSNVEQISYKNPSHVVDEINGWVSRQTYGKIPLILNPEQISPEASCVIINAIYFQGKWKFPFDKMEVGDFFAPSGPKKTKLMSRQGFYRYGESPVLNAQIVEIPFQGMKSSLIVVLPMDKNGLPLLLNALKLAPSLLNKALGTMRKELVALSIPNFTIQTTLDLKEVFQKMEMEHILSKSSGLTGIMRNEVLLVTTAVQKAVIEVQEEIAALTTTPEASESGPVTETPDLDQIIFLADHPFLFYVKAYREQLIAGVFNEPSYK